MHCPLPFTDMALSKKGSFSYLQDNVYFVVIDDNLTARIECINNNVARLYLVGGDNAQIPVPGHIQLLDLNNVVVAPFMESFFITWIDSYVLTVHGQPFIKLTTQKQQSLSAPSAAASGVI